MYVHLVVGLLMSKLINRWIIEGWMILGLVAWLKGWDLWGIECYDGGNGCSISGAIVNRIITIRALVWSLP